MKLRIVEEDDGVPCARIQLDDGRVVLCRPEDACTMMDRLKSEEDVSMKEIYNSSTIKDADYGTDIVARIYPNHDVVLGNVSGTYPRCTVTQRDLPELINALQRAYELGHDNIQDTSRRSDTQET